MYFIHNFWVETFPMFQNGYEFIYVFLDIATILSLIEAVIILPSCLLFGGSKDIWND
ncbi:MAG: hypothetical protein J6J36_05100 [Clostridia bacterium]|nr:hypothetical protein [Clostridia bacterium]